MTQVTIQVNVNLSPVTLRALEQVALLVVKALRGEAEQSPAPAAAPVFRTGPVMTERPVNAPDENADFEDDPPEEFETAAQGAEVTSPAPKWTPERITALATPKAMGESWAEIFGKLNAMPGGEIASVAALQWKHSDLKRSGQLPVVKVAEKIVHAVDPWSAARELLMTRLKADGQGWARITELVNELPGRELTEKAVTVRYHLLKTQGRLPAVPAKIEVSVARLLEDHAGRNADVAATDWQAISDWAKFNKVDIEGLAQGAALKKINAARTGFALPVFVVLNARGPVETLPAPTIGGALLAKVSNAPKFKRRAA
jgi:hypothetical protein